ncbi:unnamed protein product [Parajaminaea phylloscopi]
MPAALGPCTACGTSASKYKCPQCLAPTCSLACSKKHRGAHSDAAAAAAPAPASGPSTSTAHDVAAGPSRRHKAQGFVSLKSYDAAQFLHDYHFLSHIGRQVSNAGKQLLNQGMLPEQVEAMANAVTPHNAGPPATKGPAGPSYKPDFEKVRHLRTRQALKDNVRLRRCKVMWLPEGMARETQNRSVYVERQKRTRWTCEIAMPNASHTAQEIKDVTIHHDLPPNLPVEAKVLSELERQSWRLAPANWKASHRENSQQDQNRNAAPSRSSRKRGRKGAAKRAPEDQASEAAADANEAAFASGSNVGEAAPNHHDANKAKVYYISDRVLQDGGLLLPPAGTSAESDANAEAASLLPKPHSRLPGYVTLAVQVHHNRLRNESSLKYLQWWERRGKEEEELEKQQAEAVDEQAMERQLDTSAESLSSNVPTEPAGMRRRQDAAHEHAAETSQTAGVSQALSFLPPNLLAQLSKRLEATRASAAQPPMDAKAVKEQKAGKLAVEYSSESEDDNERPKEVASARAGTSSLVQDAGKQNQAIRLLYEVPRNLSHRETADDASADAANGEGKGATHGDAGWGGPGIEALLRSLPRNHAVVEFPRIEVWNSEALRRAAQTGPGDSLASIELVSWEADPTTQEHAASVGEEVREQDSADAKPPSSPSKADSLCLKSSLAQTASDAPVSIVTTGKDATLRPAQQCDRADVGRPLAGIAYYESESEEEEDDDGKPAHSMSQKDVKAPRLDTSKQQEQVSQPQQPQSLVASSIAHLELLAGSSSSESACDTPGTDSAGESQPKDTSLAAVARSLGFTSSETAVDSKARTKATGTGSNTRGDDRSGLPSTTIPGIVGDEEVDWDHDVEP